MFVPLFLSFLLNYVNTFTYIYDLALFRSFNSCMYKYISHLFEILISNSNNNCFLNYEIENKMVNKRKSNSNLVQFSRKNSSNNNAMETEQLTLPYESESSDLEYESDDEFIIKDAPKIDTSLISEIVDFILNEKSSKRSFNV